MGKSTRLDGEGLFKPTSATVALPAPGGVELVANTTGSMLAPLAMPGAPTASAVNAIPPHTPETAAHFLARVFDDNSGFSCDCAETRALAGDIMKAMLEGQQGLGEAIKQVINEIFPEFGEHIKFSAWMYSFLGPAGRAFIDKYVGPDDYDKPLSEVLYGKLIDEIGSGGVGLGVLLAIRSPTSPYKLAYDVLKQQTADDCPPFNPPPTTNKHDGDAHGSAGNAATAVDRSYDPLVIDLAGNGIAAVSPPTVPGSRRAMPFLRAT